VAIAFKYKDISNDPEQQSYVLDTDAIREHVDRFIRTSKGELLDNPSYGCSAKDYIYENLTETMKLLFMSDLRADFSTWEPRVQLVGLDMKYNSDIGTVEVNYELIVPEFNTKIISTVLV